MSYRNPRFSYAHTLADVGDDGFGSTTDAYLTARTRLLDYQKQVLAGQSDAFNETWFKRATTLQQTYQRLFRIIIPDGHNFGNDRNLQFGWFDTFTEDATTVPLAVLNDGAQIESYCPATGIFSIELEAGDTDDLEFAAMLYWAHWTGLANGLPGLGEMWWTNLVQTTTGAHFGWEDVFEPTQSRFESQTGAVYTNVLGEPRRRFTLDHHGMSGSDYQLYRELWRYTGYGSKPFWYDHLDSADVERSVNTLEDFNDITSEVNLVAAISSANAPDGVSDCTQLVALAGSLTASGALGAPVFEDSTDTDWRNSILQFDILFVTDADWFDVAADFRIRVLSAETNGESFYQPLNGYLDNKDPDVWIRVQVDLELDVQPDAPDPTRGYCDLTDVTQLQFIFEPEAGGDAIKLANVRLIDKTKQPVLVEMIPGRLRNQQDRRAPKNSFGPAYTIHMEMLEVTS